MLLLCSLFQSTEGSRSDYSVVLIPRCREVHQSYATSVATTVSSTLASVPAVLADQPQLLLVNGPGTCVPVCLVVWLLTRFRLLSSTLVFVESVCRVQRLSVSGEIMLRVADQVLVHWEELREKYPTTKYIGKFL